jgi:hypothetical protein
MSTQKTPDYTPTQPAATQAKQKAGELVEQAKSAARDVTQNAASAAADQAAAAKSSVADEMSGVASALRTAAREMRSGSPQERTFGQIAEGLADASESMRNKDLSEMAQDISGFARKNPLVFLGGAALIGFAATRFAKASGARQTRADVSAPGTMQHSTMQHGDYS